MDGHRQRHALFGSDVEARPNRLFDVLQSLFLGRALADAAGNGRTLGYEDAVLVTVNGHDEFHNAILCQRKYPLTSMIRSNVPAEVFWTLIVPEPSSASCTIALLARVFPATRLAVLAPVGCPSPR